MPNPINTNGRPLRKTLATQLDRLDGIIDTLADGLNNAVADAVRDAVTQAVQQSVESVLREVLARPELLQRIAGQTTPPVAKDIEPKPEQPSTLKKVFGWLGTTISNACSWLRQTAGSVCGWIGETVRGLPSKVRSAAGTIRCVVVAKTQSLRRFTRQLSCTVWELRGPVSLSLLVGFIVGAGGYLTGPVIASVALGLCGTATSLVWFLLAPFLALWRSMQTEET